MTEPLAIKIKVGPTGHDPETRIQIGGEDLTHHIRSFAIQAGVGEMTRVQLDFIDVEVDLDGTIDLTSMGDEWATYRLGKVIRDEMQREGDKS